MTEDEARLKQCCGPEGTGDQRLPYPTRWCVGSSCMAWRWINTHIPDPAGGPDLVRSTRTHGACGLAGPWFQNYRSAPETAQ